ncbi:hypothetical protein P152DRAFT_469690 [Eremomyces bilateralis CBS 781.70]|uniref:DNA polymerase n=1 Tax=Eremomyces bilateralis CBS 781.70 TaxID=1392243 RepID=A0A6G1GH71_9PEZI|nr:uncharacterized protein P152DRAFT_469690 [Eremomyces bilateralis CBS 781.70]KAF1817219.1 hypothetical protein P152DRAFT_469690 [Eremomyces bilateralis CBS 781.70]
MASKGTCAKTKASKRRRSSLPNLVPDAQRIFANLNFYFFPNNDIHAGRKARIRVSERYGATWVRDWDATAGITHIIVDHRLTYQDIPVYLKLPEGIPPEVIVVNEEYPSDCIRSQMILDAAQSHYQVPGTPNAAKATSNTGPVASTRIPSQVDVEPKTKQNNQVARRSRSPLPEHDLKGSTATHGDPSESDRVEYGKSSSHDTGCETGQADGETDETKLPQTAPAAPDKYGYELIEAIQEVAALRDIPLELDDVEESDSPPQDEPPSDSDSEDHRPAHKKSKSNHSKFSNFQCMHSHPAPANYSTATATPSSSTIIPPSHPNAQIITLLSLQCDYYTRIQDPWRSLAYRKALTTLKNQPHPITTAAQARQLRHIGDRLARKIEEIATTSRLCRFESTLTDPRDRLLQLFLGVYDVGLAQASKWVDFGCRSLADVQTCPQIALTDNQRVGIAHYDDFQARIPRDEVRQLGAIVTNALRAIDPAFEVTIGGSYRRGARDSGDVDLLITKPGASTRYIRSTVLEQLVPELTARAFLRARLAGGKDSVHAVETTKCHGACSLTPTAPWRRIDLLLVPEEEMGAALIYFTGNDIFNRSLRLLASRKGMRLNQRGLFEDAMRGRGRMKVTEGRLVEGGSERGIFERLGVPWREPTERVC